MVADDVHVVKTIIANYAQIKEVINKVIEIKDKLIDLCLEGNITEDEFYRVSSLLTPQSRSPLWEKYFIKKHDALRVSANKNAGDLVLNKKYYEYKSSYNDSGSVNIVQVRLWQPCDYIIEVIQIDEKNVTVTTFVLTHDQMEKEMESAGPAHGTAEANENNENVELRISFDIGDEYWEKWIYKYTNKLN
ncbi:MAG: hypothetical protein ACR2P9_01650 [Gammaproteobacteria bacterium]